MKPKRIQLKRTKGWKMPAGAVKVDRSTKWGNPFTRDIDEALIAFRAVFLGCRGDNAGVRQASLILYRAWASDALATGGMFSARPPMTSAELKAAAVSELRGKDLACWCKPGDPCHADILLELANS